MGKEKELMDTEKKKQKGIFDYIFQFAGDYRSSYIKVWSLP